MVKIYEGEGGAPKLLRQQLINWALEEESRNKFKRPASVVSIAKLLRDMEQYDSKKGFEDNNTAYHAQQMARGLERELRNFYESSKQLKKNTPDYERRVDTFNDSCKNIISENLEGVSRKSTFWNCIAPAVNGFLKLIGAEPYKLDTTNFASNQGVKERLQEIKYAGIAKEKIEEVDRDNDYSGPNL